MVAVLQPLLLAGVLTASTAGAAAGFEPQWPVGAGFVVAGLLWVGSICLYARIGPLGLSCLLLLFVFVGTIIVSATGVMSERGVRTTCVVTGIDKQTRTVTTYGSQNQAPSTTTETYYVHALDCAAPQVTSITSGGHVAEVGGSADIDYDPEGQLGPMPAGLTDSHDTLRFWVYVALGAAVLLRVIGVLWEWYDPWL
ncbi:hypothetical protein Aab01nite_52110 [Paractinoplanes abujensis]|nr:hypothetical protein Aab01nite_52110 [Actinoplanes abujensis]